MSLESCSKEAALITDEKQKENMGAWVIHHGRKLIFDVSGPAEFSAINAAAKAATLLAKIGQTDEAVLDKKRIKAIAQGANIDPKLELKSILEILEKRRLIDQSNEEVSVLGVTTRGSLSQAYDIFLDSEPSNREFASIGLSEIASRAPVLRSKASEIISDTFKLSSANTTDFLDHAERIGFVDKEGSGADELLFNGNLFRKDSVNKTLLVLSSLHATEQSAVNDVAEQLRKKGCLEVDYVKDILTTQLFEKLVAAGLYDLNGVTNEQGCYTYVTSPEAFHKFVSPMVDDCFDMAKSLVAALTYGMNRRSGNQGRINNLPALLRKLISGHEVGPTTSIGKDYRVLEIDGVVRLRASETRKDLFYLRLLKKEVGELALQVLTQGNAYETSLTELPAASMTGYVSPEENRIQTRKRQSQRSKQGTMDILENLRSGEPQW